MIQNNQIKIKVIILNAKLIMIVNIFFISSKKYSYNVFSSLQYYICTEIYNSIKNLYYKLYI